MPSSIIHQELKYRRRSEMPVSMNGDETFWTEEPPSSIRKFEEPFTRNNKSEVSKSWKSGTTEPSSIDSYDQDAPKLEPSIGTTVPRATTWEEIRKRYTSSSGK
jgi:hypothetical protein